MEHPDPPNTTELTRLSDPRIELSVERTSLTLERTQLAWIRTTLSFITAGIAIDKGTALLHEALMVPGTAWSTTGHCI